MEIKRAYRFRFYPTPEQEVILARTFGCARFAYNHMLRIRTDAWFKEQKRIGYHDTSALLTELKKQPETIWLNEVSSVPVQQSLRHLQTAFGNFFAKRAKYPTFKSKHDKQAAEYTSSAFKWDGKTLKLAKMDAPLNIRWSRTLPKAAKLTTATVSKDAAGRYFVSLLCDDSVSAKPVASGQIGIDLGLTHFVILSTGEKITAPNTFRKNESRLAKLQRRLAKKQKGSANRIKAKLKVARLHAKIADTRKDFLHKLSTRLVNENQVIAIESLAVNNMQKNHCLAKSISDAAWSEFVRQLEYKSLWYGRTLIGIDRWYPSSKRCSDCGHTVPKMPLKVRDWVCPECGSIHDRDINAARNILAAGLAVSALGESVNPVCI
ncbi:IS200/IS605 family element RNA-guided endonuclease TnpB [Ferrovum sp.]|uniref:IS200/IS605 family element RNA-guided endonuclease TnpB n=1 Tax=Ferrovum sp. TaxID=2609467 RepID=UPI00260B3C98|nr:IS200/IS605 family element RNA-guided endonuclease TnpB [Ferrovum sp.]